MVILIGIKASSQDYKTLWDMDLGLMRRCGEDSQVRTGWKLILFEDEFNTCSAAQLGTRKCPVMISTVLRKFLVCKKDDCYLFQIDTLSKVLLV